MTRDEIIREWEHIHDTRIAILCGTNEPTSEQRRMALKEADEAVERLSGGERTNKHE